MVVRMHVVAGLAVGLMAQDHRGTPTYFGRRDIAAFLADLPLRAIPWQGYAA